MYHLHSHMRCRLLRSQELIRYLYRDEKGSFTIESSLVFPFIFISTVALLFLSLLIYEQVSLYSTASLAAERSASVWDNSDKNMVTGAYEPNDHDGLYWRLFDDSASDLFQFITNSGPTVVELNANQPQPHNELSLPQRKLKRIEPFLPEGSKGAAVYTNELLNRRITVRLQSPFLSPAFLDRLLNQSTISAEASSSVADPVEFIRGIDLVRTYLPEIKNALSPSDMRKTIDAFRNRIKPNTTEVNSFRYHNEARAYLQKLVQGTATRRNIEKEGDFRIIDALDREGIAHQAYLDFKTYNKDMKTQMKKDIELLKSGKVNGVVWHFFRRTNKSNIGPSDNLRKMLENNGIVVVIHD